MIFQWFPTSAMVLRDAQKVQLVHQTRKGVMSNNGRKIFEEAQRLV